MIIFPDHIKKGDTIGITAPSDGANLDKLDFAIENLQKLGYKVIETESARRSSKFVSTDGEIRAREFMELWKDENVKWIISARGGEFLMEMLPYLDEYKNVIARYKPKWIQGYSDTSVLLHYFTTNYNIATVNTENVGGFAMTPFHKSISKTLEMLEGESNWQQESFDMYEGEWCEKAPTDSFNLTDKVEYKHLQGKEKDIIEGILIGGCIDALINISGTRYDNTYNFCKQFKEGVIWYIDDCEMPVTSLYRALWKMRELGYFDNCNGVLIGRTRAIQDVGDFTFIDALEKGLGDIPVIYDVDIGHVAPQWTMINGAYARCEFDNGKGILMQYKK